MYITVQEFKNAPTGIDTYSLIPGATQAQNDAELTNVIRRASAWVDQYCNQVLEATTNTETKEVTMTSSGLIRIHPNNVPIIQILDSVQYRVNPADPWTSISPEFIQASTRHFTIYNLNTLSVPPSLGLQYPGVGYRTPTRRHNLQQIPITVQYTYVNGYVNTTLRNPVNANQIDSIALVRNLGITAGQSLTIYDNEKTETVTVQSIDSSGFITFTSPLIFNHDAGTPISALPATVKEATILMTAYLIKERGSLAVSMSENSLQGVQRYKDAADIDTAKEMLYIFKRGMTS